MSLAARARKLFLSRGIDEPKVTGLVWSGADENFPAIGVEGLPDGARVVEDHWIMEYVADDCGHISRWRDRVTYDAEDFGLVYAWDGRVIGRVAQVHPTLFEFEWPDGLGFIAPGFEHAAPGGDVGRDVALDRAADDRRVAAELADAERARRRSAQK